MSGSDGVVPPRRAAVRRAGPTVPHQIPGFAPPARGEDPELDQVTDAILRRDAVGSIFASALRETYDQLYDGQRTGRYRPDQLRKTESAHMGTLVEIALHRAFDFDDGVEMDYRVVGIEVDCKFSKRLGGWMLPREAYTRDHLCLVVWASDESSRWEAGLVRATDQPGLLGAMNQDRKRPLTPAGESRIRWLYREPALPENLLLHIDQATRDRIFDPTPRVRRLPSGQDKINMLFRLVQRRLVNRASILTVAQQDDSLKRARDARLPKHLGREGILVLGHQEGDPAIAMELALPVPTKGSFVSVRVAPAPGQWSGPITELDGGPWRVAEASDPLIPAPLVKRAAARGQRPSASA